MLNQHQQNKIDDFKNRKIKANDIFVIQKIDKNTSYDFVKKYHYLKDAKFFSFFNYGLFINDLLVGVATYSNPQGISSLKGWFNLTNQDKTVLELSRLCLLPCLNKTNATSYLLGNSLKKLKEEGIRAVITLADSKLHVGSIYQVCNFKYYGLTDKKTDFYCADGRVNPRGKTSDVQGVWLPRTRKHRYAYIFDKTLKCNYAPLPYPKQDEVGELECCNGLKVVYDKRFKVVYPCPICCKSIK